MRRASAGDRETTVDGQGLAGDVARGGAREEQHSRRDLVGGRETRHRRSREQRSGELFERHHRRGHRGLDDARRHRVHAHAVLRPRDGEGFGAILRAVTVYILLHGILYTITNFFAQLLCIFSV